MRLFHVVPLLMLLSCSAAAVAVEPTFGPHPRLATTAREWEESRRRPDYSVQRTAAVKTADALLAAPPTLPDGYGSWTFYYSCPDDGSDLRPVSSAVHECRKCKKQYTDERTVAAYRCQLHHRLEEAALRLGWAYAHTADERYAAEVRRCLLHLADQYAGYPERLDRWGRRGVLAPLGGRRYVQSLDEAVGVIRLAKAYDLTHDSQVWSDADRKHVEQDFFRATAQTLLAFNQDVNNHQTWYDAGLMAIASVLGDAALVDRVLTMTGGYYDQLQRSLGDDGLWYEGTPAYQNYAIQALLEIVDAGRRLGLPLHEAPRLRKLLGSSLQMTYPDGTFPVINDSDPGSIRSFAPSYEWAWRTYGEPRFAQAAAWKNPKKLAELLGPDAQSASPLETKSFHFGDLGLVALRAGEGADQACVFFDYGPHGGGHGHYDKLNLTLFARGREWLIDVGRIGYNHQEYRTWVKHTAAHNTVVVNESDQWATAGRLLWFQADGDATACAAECSTAYLGVLLRRYLHLTPQLLIDVYEVESARGPIQIDWFAHARCREIALLQLTVGEANSETVGTGTAYQHLLEGRRWPNAAASRWLLTQGKQHLPLWCDGDASDELLTAVGIGQRIGEKAPTLIRRRRDARQARFITVYDLSERGDYVTGVKAAGDAAEVRVDTLDGKVHVQFTLKGVDVR